MIGDNLLKSNRELHSPHSLFGVMSSGISGHLEADDYDSMYESRSALTTVQKQHFVEWFSGSALDSYWTTVDVSGTNTFQMADSVDGGFEIISGATSGNRGMITFNNKRQYDPASFELISTYSTDGSVIGMWYDFPSSSRQAVYSSQGNDNGNIQLSTSTGSPTTTVTSTTARSATAKTFKLVGTASNVTMTIDGVDLTVSTTNLPTVKMQPSFMSHAEAGAGARTGNIRYLECYNT